MKKKLKIFLITFGIILLLVGGYLLYILKFKQFDVADAAVDEIIEEPYTIELPDGTELVLDNEGLNEKPKPEDKSDKDGSKNPTDSNQTETSTDNQKPEDDKSTSTEKTDGTTNSPKPTEKAETPKKETVASIKNKYLPVFEALQVQADEKLNTLIGHAKKEYADKKANKEKIDFAYFFNKYNGAAKELEASTDAVFNGVLAAVEKELAANEFEPAYAKNFKEEYDLTKKERRDTLIKKAIGR